MFAKDPTTLVPFPTGEEKRVGAAAPTRIKRFASRLFRHPNLWVAFMLLGLLAAGIAAVHPQVRAWHHLRAARSELQRWHNAQAIRHLKICMYVWPNDPEVLLLAARSTRRARSYAEAERLLEMYQHARGLDDACTLEQLLLTAERNIDQVLELCWRYVEQGHPEAPLILEALAFGYMRQYRLVEARACLERWKQLQPDNAQIFCLEGLLYLDYAHTRSVAIENFRRAVELDADHEEARQGLAVALISGRMFAEAAQHLERLLQNQPDSPSLQVGLAECFDGLGKDAEAIQLLDAVLAEQPEFAPALSLRARLALKNGDPVKAELMLRKAFRLNPVDHRTRYSLILCLHQNGKDEEAKQLQKQLEQLEDDLARFNDIVTREIVKRPRDPALHCEMGQLLLRSGQREEGLRWLQSALRIDPQYAPARQAIEEYRNKAKAEVQ
jgi:tetratricopeptide (TPR) repeat protein